MPNCKHEINTIYIPEVIDSGINLLDLKKGDLKKGHILLKGFEEYEKWKSNEIQRPLPLTDNIIYLATYLKEICLFSEQYQSEKKVKEIIKKKFCNNHEIKGLLYEFRTCMHFNIYHRNAKWLPNFKNTSEADIEVQHKSDGIFYVECTSKKEKETRCKIEDIVCKDILNSLKDKKEQTKNLEHPRIIAIHFPEQLDIYNQRFNKKLGMILIYLFINDSSYSTISAVTITTYTPITIKKEGSKVIYDTELDSLSYINPKAKYQLTPESINPNGF